jgi:ATP-dependent protease ClpP protease subunit
MPKKGEKKKDFMDRCIPMVLKEGTAEDDSQANAMCNSMWEDGKKEKESAMATRDDGKGKTRCWFEITAKADKSEIWLYDEIGKNWFGEGIGAKEFLAEINAIKSPHIDMHINSPGGAVFEGAAIYNAIKRHPATVHTYIDGIAASIASVIALAGDRIIMAANSLFMLHNPSGMAFGTSDDMRKTADVLDKVCGTMMGAYMEKCGKTEAEIKALMDAETYMDADEAMEAGFCDEVGLEMDMAACASFAPVLAKLGFKHIPQVINGKKETPSLKECEHALRDVGCSRKAAKTILAKGYSDGLRDAGADDTAPPVTDPPPGVETPLPTPIVAAAVTPDPPIVPTDRYMELYLRAEKEVPSQF